MKTNEPDCERCSIRQCCQPAFSFQNVSGKMVRRCFQHNEEYRKRNNIPL